MIFQLHKHMNNFTRILMVAIVYVFLIGFCISFINSTVPLICPTLGFGLALVLIYGNSIWIGIFLGTFISTYYYQLPLIVVLSISFGNTFAILVGANLLKQSIGESNFFHHPINIFKFNLIAGILSSFISATIGVGSLFFTRIISNSRLFYELLVWWLSNATGVIIIVPFVLLLVKRDTGLKSFKQIIEFLSLVLFLLIISYLIFGGLLAGTLLESLTYKYLLLPFYLWVLFRFEKLEIAMITLLVSIVAMLNISIIQISSNGVSIVFTNNELILSLQIFLIFLNIIAFILKTIINERRQMLEDIARLERLNIIGEMAVGIAHEIRNPMTTVRGFIQMMMSGHIKASQDKYFSLMLEELDKANSIITEYLFLAKNKSLELKETNLNNIVHNVYPLLNVDAKEEGKSIDLILEDIPNLYLDEKEISHLIINLVRNGIEASDIGGIVFISTYVFRNKLIMTIKDHGKGIPKNIQERIGTPFLTTKDYGTGLGLAASYSIASRHNASIKFESNEGGTIFYISFPLNNKNC